MGAFLVKDNADRLKAQLESRYPPVSVVPFESANGTFYRVRIGRLPSEAAAQNLASSCTDSEAVHRRSSSGSTTSFDSIPRGYLCIIT